MFNNMYDSLIILTMTINTLTKRRGREEGELIRAAGEIRHLVPTDRDYGNP